MSSIASQSSRLTAIGRGQRASGGADRHQVVEADHACNYSRIPNLLLEDAATGKLGPSAIVLYLHYKRVAFELHGQPMAESLRETKRRTGLSNGTILTARAQLVEAGWASLHEESDGEPVIVMLLERWDDNCHGHTPSGGQILTAPGQKLTASGQKPAASGRFLTAAHLKIGPVKTEDYEDPLSGGGDFDRETTDTRVPGLEPQLPGMLTEVPRGSPTPSRSNDSAAEELLESFYRDGLGGDPDRDLASKQRERELESARSLVDLGVVPPQVATWAREKIAEGRITFVTLATLVQAWPAWRAARRSADACAARRTMAYQHEPWGEDRPPPIAASDLARGAAL